MSKHEAKGPTTLDEALGGLPESAIRSVKDVQLQDTLQHD